MKTSLWILPLGLILGMGLYHRQYKEVVDIPEYGPKVHAQLTAYVPIVRKTENLTSKSTQKEIIEVAREWTAARKAGKLRDVRKVSPFDTSRTVAKEAILGAKALVLGLVRMQIQKAWELGEIDQASNWTSNALELNSIMSEADMASYLAAIQYEIYLVRMALPHWNEISLRVRNEWLVSTDPRVQVVKVSSIVELDSQLLPQASDNPFRRLRAKERAREVKELVLAQADPKALGVLVRRSPGELVSTLALAKQALAVIRNRERVWAPYRQSLKTSLVAKSN